MGGGSSDEVVAAHLLVFSFSSWRGESGARRKVAVWDYDSTDPEDETYHEITTHLSIFTLGIDG